MSYALAGLFFVAIIECNEHNPERKAKGIANATGTENRNAKAYVDAN